jgi:hypothetical protein
MALPMLLRAVVIHLSGRLETTTNCSYIDNKLFLYIGCPPNRRWPSVAERIYDFGYEDRELSKRDPNLASSPLQASTVYSRVSRILSSYVR